MRSQKCFDAVTEKPNKEVLKCSCRLAKTLQGDDLETATCTVHDRAGFKISCFIDLYLENNVLCHILLIENCIFFTFSITPMKEGTYFRNPFYT